MALVDPKVAGSADAVSPAVPMPSLHLHNLFRAQTNLFSGSAPENQAAFAELAGLGVKTILSVDGAKPDVESARQHGLRYLHLPVGYDGISPQQVAELTKAIRAAAGPFYVHCHHGFHRGPAAVAVICESIGGWTTNQAEAWLRQAGTSRDYPGLYRSVLGFQSPSTEALEQAKDTPEICPPTSRVEAMVALDETFDRLKAAQSSSETNARPQAGLAPGEAATVLWEKLRELARSEETKKQPDPYRDQLAAAVMAADRLRNLLRDPNASRTSRSAALQTITQACSSCHQKFRNPP